MLEERLAGTPELAQHIEVYACVRPQDVCTCMGHTWGGLNANSDALLKEALGDGRSGRLGWGWGCPARVVLLKILLHQSRRLLKLPCVG
jgi:hypothetical protein